LHFVLTRHDFGGSKVHRIEAGRAKAVDLHTRHAVTKARNQCRRARDIAACFADRVDTTKHHILDERRVELVAVLYCCKRLCSEVECGYLVQRSVGLATPARAADVIVDECLWHGDSPVWVGVKGCARSAIS